MSLINRLKRIEKDLRVNDDDFVYIHVGKPSFTLYGTEAREYVAKEQAAGRLQNPKTTYGEGNNSSITVYLPHELGGEFEVSLV